MCVVAKVFLMDVAALLGVPDVFGLFCLSDGTLGYRHRLANCVRQFA